MEVRDVLDREHFSGTAVAADWCGCAGRGAFVGGCQFGEERVTAKWDAEKLATAQVVAKQAEHVAAVNAQESTINQEISNEFQKAKAAIATDGRDLLARVPQRVRVDAASRNSIMPGISIVAARVDAATADAVPAAEQPASIATCEKLAEDAAQTTLMVVEFQRWYREQSGTSSRRFESLKP
jgi:predicted Rossmann fold nucleotide-binding protein DprA/Smf involved in DNA uptake